VNALVFAAAAALARNAPQGAAALAPRASGIPWILPAIAVSGAVSFSYEVLWFRLLGQLIGGSTAAFSTMLASFLAGIALGSALASRWAKTPAAASLGFALAQLATGVSAWLAFLAADHLPAWAQELGVSVNALGPGALLAAAVLLPLTICIGSTFPFAVRLLARDAADASAASARVYAWNTVGSIAGAIGTGYFLLPWLGFVGTVVCAALANLALALAASATARPVRRVLAAGAIAAALFLALFPTPRPDSLLRSSPLGGDYGGTLSYFAVGRSSSVALIDHGLGWRLTNNGLPESYIQPVGSPPVASAAQWLSLLPVLVRPETAHVLIIGLGAGITLAAVPSSVETIDVIELEPEVIAANRAVRERAGGDPLADPRVSVRIGDARGALALADRRWDAIVSQPSHPWTSGASHLYTREFFELVRSRLSPAGVFVQWIGAAFVDPDRLRALLAAQTAVFANVQVYRPEGGAIVMMASDAPFDVVNSAPRAIAASPRDFAEAGIHHVEDVVAALAFDADGTRAFAGDAAPNTDDRNLFATSRRPSAGVRPGWVENAFAPRDPIPALAGSLDLERLVSSLQESGRPERVQHLAERLNPARRALALGWLALGAQRARQAQRNFNEALAADSSLESAAIGLALADPSADVARLPERARAVIEAQRGDRQLARARDALLAQWQPGELLYSQAAEQRARWRLELGGPSELDEAMAILDTLLETRLLPRLFLLRAEIAARQGHRDVAWLSLQALSEHGAAPGVAERGLALAQSLGPSPSRALLPKLDRLARRRAAAAAIID
jgi:spermidine synthase